MTKKEEKEEKEEVAMSEWTAQLLRKMCTEMIVNSMTKSCLSHLSYLDELVEILGASCPDEDSASRFKGITDKMCDTYKAKNKDYGDSFHKLFEECGMTYAYGHLKEKLERVKSLMNDEAKVKGESMKDSLYDLANYAILTIMELEK